MGETSEEAMSEEQPQKQKKKSEAEARKMRRLRNFVLDWRFQMKYTTMIVSVATLLSAILGVFLFNKIQENSRMVAIDEAFAEELALADAQVLVAIVGALVLFLVLLAALSVFITHRVVGPVFVLRRYIRELAEGGLPRVRRLRKGDEFVELLDDFVKAVDALEERANAEIAILEEARLKIPAGDTEVAEKLEALIEHKKEAVHRRRTGSPSPGRGTSAVGLPVTSLDATGQGE